MMRWACVVAATAAAQQAQAAAEARAAAAEANQQQALARAAAAEAALQRHAEASLPTLSLGARPLVEFSLRYAGPPRVEK